MGTEIELGSVVMDPLTNCNGTVVRTVRIGGWARVCVQPSELKDGRPVEEVWFDETRVELVRGPVLD